MTRIALEARLKEALDRVNGRDLVIDPEVLHSFCALTGYDYEHYRTRNFVPTGYLMTFTAPVVTEVFVGLYSNLSNLIKGIIHSRSRIEVLSPLTIDPSHYVVRIEAREIKEKQGKKGNYLVRDLDLILENTHGHKVASDLHQFFLRI